MPVLPEIQQTSKIVGKGIEVMDLALLSSKMDNGTKYSNIIENLDKVKNKTNRSFYKQ